MLNARDAKPHWLVDRPIAHRGLHDAARGLVENTPGAARAAIEAGFAIECDVQLTRDGDAVVFHDFELGRLTGATGAVCDRTAAELARIAYATGPDHITSLTALLDVIGGRTPLICEIKSGFDEDMRLANRVRAIVAGYPGPVALKSFDPVVIAHLRPSSPCPLGIVAEADYADPEWAALPPMRRRELAEMLHFSQTRPDFISYSVDDLPHAVPYLCRAALGLPVMTWTVRRPEQRALATRWADQIVFEGFVP